MVVNAPVLAASPSSSSSSPSTLLVSERPAKQRRVESEVAAPNLGIRFVFLELFAGNGELTKQVAKIVETLPPQDYFTNHGVDFLDLSAVHTLWEEWRALVDAGARLIFHVAPPCATFSRARDRSSRTKLRSSSSPGGLYASEPRTLEGNLIAKHTALSVDFLVNELGAAGSWEQPAGSYMFPFLETLGLPTAQPDKVVLLHQCKFGRPWKKPTTFTCYGGLRLRALDKRCTSSSPCSRPFHITLGFGSAATAPAAAYPIALCNAYAADVAAYVAWSSRRSAVARASVHIEGVVERHQDRGHTRTSARASREAEDASSWAGALEQQSWVNAFPISVSRKLVYVGLFLGIRCPQLFRGDRGMARLPDSHGQDSVHLARLSVSPS